NSARTDDSRNRAETVLRNRRRAATLAGYRSGATAEAGAPYSGDRVPDRRQHPCKWLWPLRFPVRDQRAGDCTACGIERKGATENVRRTLDTETHNRKIRINRHTSFKLTESSKPCESTEVRFKSWRAFCLSRAALAWMSHLLLIRRSRRLLQSML